MNQNYYKTIIIINKKTSFEKKNNNVIKKKKTFSIPLSLTFLRGIGIHLGKGIVIFMRIIIPKNRLLQNKIINIFFKKNSHSIPRYSYYANQTDP